MIFERTDIEERQEDLAIRVITFKIFGLIVYKSKMSTANSKIVNNFVKPVRRVNSIIGFINNNNKNNEDKSKKY
jgi:hypothetical protein